jgi:hypothetical protein
MDGRVILLLAPFFSIHQTNGIVAAHVAAFV